MTVNVLRKYQAYQLLASPQISRASE